MPFFIDPENPSTYDKFRKPESSFHNKKYERMMRKIPKRKSDKVLEIGCGTGIYTKFLVKDFKKVVATDADKEMCRQAKKEAPRAKIRVADAQLLPFPDSSFNGVFGVSILHHITDCHRAFQEIFRVLKPGGWIAFCEPNQLNLLTAAVQMRYGERGVTRKNMLNYAKHAGLQVVEIGEILLRSPRTSNVLDNVPGYGAIEKAVESLHLGFSVYMNAKKPKVQIR